MRQLPVTGSLGHFPIWYTRFLPKTVGNALRRHGLPPGLLRKPTTTWTAFIRTHLPLLARDDFFAAEVLTLRELVT